MPSLRNSSGADLKVKPMLDGRLRRQEKDLNSKAAYKYISKSFE